MLKSIVLFDMDLNIVPAWERWFYEFHEPEIARRFGPWLARHESFVPLQAPEEEDKQFGYCNWRLIHAYWREIPEAGPKGDLSFELPPAYPPGRAARGPLVIDCFIPAQATEDFMGYGTAPGDKQILRWLQVFRYPQGVSQEEGDDWYIHTFAPEAKKQPGLFRFFSSKTVEVKTGLPGTWPPGTFYDNLGKQTPAKWARVSEMWYENFFDWRDANIFHPPQYTKPAWAKYDRFPFLEPGKDFFSTFLLERPSDDYLRDTRFYR